MKKKLMKTLAAAFIVSALFSVATYAAEWEKQSQGWVYWLDDGNVATNTWINDDGSSYYVGSNGVMETDSWIPSGDKWYYVGSDGALLRNMMVGTNNDTTWYYVGADGSMQTNMWYQDPESGDWYYFGSDGAAYKNGWYYIDGYEYYFLKSSKMAHGDPNSSTPTALVPGGGVVGADGRRIS